MSSIHPHPLPHGALLSRYAGGEDYTDCYTALIDEVVSHEDFVRAFYTTWVFKLERWILRWAVAKPSSDAEAAALAAGARETFAAWRVEARAANQLLMCDFLGNTRSWLMTASESASSTRFYFGSAVVARTDPATGKRALGRSFRALLGFHKVYSRVLLSAARARVARSRLAHSRHPREGGDPSCLRHSSGGNDTSALRRPRGGEGSSGPKMVDSDGSPPSRG